MAAKCPDCGKEYDIALLQFSNKIKCDCGKDFGLENAYSFRQDELIFFKKLLRQIQQNKEENILKSLQRKADKICILILNTQYQKIDIEIEKKKLKEEFIKSFPDKINLYKMIYEARFGRLWKQFREIES